MNSAQLPVAIEPVNTTSGMCRNGVKQWPKAELQRSNKVAF